ncbi:MAG: hypothetical protein Q4G45_09070 [Actinomycetia bacterium]|nr:hypothetical protein [Actinomycetes bacterium]
MNRASHGQLMLDEAQDALTAARLTLLVSLRTEAQGVDLYTPVATQLGITVPAALIDV